MDSPEQKTRMSQPRDLRLIVEKDVLVPMRDGTLLYADVFRPDTTEKVPVILNISVYQKDKLWVPPPDLEEKANPYMNWETVNPEWWCPRGYACVRVDARGAGRSPGKAWTRTTRSNGLPNVNGARGTWACSASPTMRHRSGVLRI